MNPSYSAILKKNEVLNENWNLLNYIRQLQYSRALQHVHGKKPGKKGNKPENGSETGAFQRHYTGYPSLELYSGEISFACKAITIQLQNPAEM